MKISQEVRDYADKLEEKEKGMEVQSLRFVEEGGAIYQEAAKYETSE
jgi:hypothetical protein